MKIIKLFLSFVFFAFCFNTSFADNIKAQATAEFTEKLTEYVTNLIPGEGTTEVSIDMQESSEPVYSILAVRPLKELDKSNLFTQFSFQNTDVAGDERYIFNLGLGKRILNQDETMMFGFNSFVD